MSHLQYKSYPGYGDWAHQTLHYSQAVRIGDYIEISGQGAWDRETGAVTTQDIQGHIEQAFANVEAALKVAGGVGWEQVYFVRTYHVGMDMEALEATAECMKRSMPNHAPLWTAIGVEKLAFPEMKIEIEVKAHVPPK